MPYSINSTYSIILLYVRGTGRLLFRTIYFIFTLLYVLSKKSIYIPLIVEQVLPCRNPANDQCIRDPRPLACFIHASDFLLARISLEPEDSAVLLGNIVNMMFLLLCAPLPV